MEEAYINHYRETIYLVMDLVEGYTLRKFIKKTLKESPPTPAGGLDEKIICNIIRQILIALQYLHSDDIAVCHRYAY